MLKMDFLEFERYIANNVYFRVAITLQAYIDSTFLPPKTLKLTKKHTNIRLLRHLLWDCILEMYKISFCLSSILTKMDKFLFSINKPQFQEIV